MMWRRVVFSCAFQTLLSAHKIYAHLTCKSQLPSIFRNIMYYDQGVTWQCTVKELIHWEKSAFYRKISRDMKHVLPVFLAQLCKSNVWIKRVQIKRVQIKRGKNPHDMKHVLLVFLAQIKRGADFTIHFSASQIPTICGVKDPDFDKDLWSMWLFSLLLVYWLLLAPTPCFQKKTDDDILCIVDISNDKSFREIDKCNNKYFREIDKYKDKYIRQMQRQQMF